MEFVGDSLRRRLVNIDRKNKCDSELFLRIILIYLFSARSIEKLIYFLRDKKNLFIHTESIYLKNFDSSSS